VSDDARRHALIEQAAIQEENAASRCDAVLARLIDDVPIPHVLQKHELPLIHPEALSFPLFVLDVVEVIEPPILVTKARIMFLYVRSRNRFVYQRRGE